MERAVINVWTITDLLATATSPAPAPPANQAFLGCWRTDSVTTYLPDGTERVAHPPCFQLNQATTISTMCRKDLLVSWLVSSYTVVSPGWVETVITQHPARPELIGTKKRHRYAVNGQHLTVTTEAPADAKDPGRGVIRVVGETSRVEGHCPVLDYDTDADAVEPPSGDSAQNRSPTGK